ncbi:MAG: hypothetical protein ACK5WM_14600 [Rhodospirillales bacterium]
MRVAPLLSVVGLALAAGLSFPAPAQTPEGVAWRVTTPAGGGPRVSSPEICHVLYGGQCTIDLEGVRGPPSPDIPFPKVIPPEDVSFRPAGGLDPGTNLATRDPASGAPGERRDPPQQVLAPRPGASTSDVPMPPDAPRNVLNPSPNGPPMTERTAVTGRTGVAEIDTLVDALKAAGLGDQLRPNIDPNVPGIVLVAPGNALAPPSPPAAPARPAAAQRAPANAPPTAPSPAAAPSR